MRRKCYLVKYMWNKPRLVDRLIGASFYMGVIKAYNSENITDLITHIKTGEYAYVYGPKLWTWALSKMSLFTRRRRAYRPYHKWKVELH